MTVTTARSGGQGTVSQISSYDRILLAVLASIHLGTDETDAGVYKVSMVLCSWPLNK